jgi:hypothetical protein
MAAGINDRCMISDRQSNRATDHSIISMTDKEAVLAANEAFYRAFSQRNLSEMSLI